MRCQRSSANLRDACSGASYRKNRGRVRVCMSRVRSPIDSIQASNGHACFLSNALGKLRVEVRENSTLDAAELGGRWVARMNQLDANDRLDGSRARGHHHDAIRKQDCFHHRMRDEDNGLLVLLPDSE